MQPETTEDVLELMNGAIYASVLGAAMETGLFWRLAERPLPAAVLAETLDIPVNRCQIWLQILCKLGLLDVSGAGYAPSATARQAILSVQDRDTWAFQAREDRDLTGLVRDLAQNIQRVMPGWPADDRQPQPEDARYTAQFTRKLYQIHRAFAEELANLIDVRGVHRLLDLGGGSGVVSLALLRKNDALTSVVVDFEDVCRVGREIAAENRLEQRVTYLAADFLTGELPAGFDLALLCDVGLFGEALFRRIHAALKEKGHLVIIDKFSPDGSTPPPSRLLAAFLTSLESPAQTVDYITVKVVCARLQQAGFRDISTTRVPHADYLPWNIDWTLIEARK